MWRTRRTLAVREHFVTCTSHGEHFGLSKEVCEQHVLADGVATCGSHYCDEVDGHDIDALMQQLKEGMLTIRSGSPQTIGELDVTASPSIVTDFPLLSMRSCCRNAGRRAKSWLYGTTASVDMSWTDLFRTVMNAWSVGMFVVHGSS